MCEQFDTNGTCFHIPKTHEIMDRSVIVAVIKRCDNPDDDLVIYGEKPDRATIDWVMNLRKRKSVIDRRCVLPVPIDQTE